MPNEEPKIGYNANFLGTKIDLPIPKFSPSLEGAVLKKEELDDLIYAHYPHYTVVTSKVRRAPILVALNIDQKRLKNTKRKNKWKIDSRIGIEYQLNNDYYYKNRWDRGHMARRKSAAWGKELRTAQKADDETFYYTNACLQYDSFNQDEWLALEEWVLNLNLDSNDKITSLMGPIYGDNGRIVEPVGRPAAVAPSGFFKVVCFISKKTKKLDVRAFILYQDQKAIADWSGRNIFDNRTYQVTVSEIEDLTGLEFQDDIYEQNPLLYNENDIKKKKYNISHFPERIDIDDHTEIIATTDTRTYYEDDEIDVFISAALVNPKKDERKNEWIALTNLMNSTIDISGWKLISWSVESTLRRTLDLDSVLKASERKLKPGHSVVIKPVRPLILSNMGGGIELMYKRNRKRYRVDRVKYTKEDAKEQGKAVIFMGR
jgi:endonuclease G